MCYYNSLSVEPGQLAKDLKIKDAIEFDPQPFIDGFKYEPHPVIVKTDGALQLNLMNWGFLPKIVKNKNQAFAFRKGYTSLVAKCEKYSSSRFYKEAFLKRHCIIPSTGFYEKRYYRPKKRIVDQQFPYYVSPIKTKYFLIAGIFQESNFEDSGTKQLTFAVVTRSANEKMNQIHNNPKNPGRMPLILTRELAVAWLSNNYPENMNDIFDFKCPSDQISAWTVSRKFKTLENPRIEFQYKELPELNN